MTIVSIAIAKARRPTVGQRAHRGMHVYHIYKTQTMCKMRYLATTPLQVLVVLWIGYFISLVAVVEMMPRTFSRFTGFLGSKVNYIMWWCACLARVGVRVRSTTSIIVSRVYTMWWCFV